MEIGQIGQFLCDKIIRKWAFEECCIIPRCIQILGVFRIPPPSLKPSFSHHIQRSIKMSNNREATELIRYCAEAVGNTYTFGHLTSSIYDTAWVSVIRKPDVPGMCTLARLYFPQVKLAFSCLGIPLTFKCELSN